jgi:hypothetical protein
MTGLTTKPSRSGTIKAAAPPGAKLLPLEMVVPDHDREFLGVKSALIADAPGASFTTPHFDGHSPMVGDAESRSPACWHRCKIAVL